MLYNCFCMNLTESIKQKALELGFDVIGITDSLPLDERQAKFFTDWLNAGFAGQMHYMHRNFSKRVGPAELLENARSVIVVGLNYKPAQSSSADIGKVAVYGQYQDYHEFMKKLLRQLIDFIRSGSAGEAEFKICVDSVPLVERSFAKRAGIGFIGKNHMLINPELGPEIFLGEIITTLELKYDEPLTNECSNCDKCIAACPAGALMSDGRFDSNKCISYLTIEYKDRIPAEVAEKMGGWVFGCDECVLACPYHENAPVCKNKSFKLYPDRAALDPARVLKLNERQFNEEFSDSAIKRTGLERLKRNSRICLANANRP